MAKRGRPLETVYQLGQIEDEVPDKTLDGNRSGAPNTLPLSVYVE